jgi:putative ABC transport system permease protein
VRLIIGNGMLIVAVGLAVGGVAALGATRLLEGFLYGVSAADPATFALVSAVLLAVALIAQGVPVARAMRVDPTVALRQE